VTVLEHASTIQRSISSKKSIRDDSLWWFGFGLL